MTQKEAKRSAIRNPQSAIRNSYDPLLYGGNQDTGLVAVEHVEKKTSDQIVLFFRENDKIIEKQESFNPFIAVNADVIADCPLEFKSKKLKGRGRLNLLALFSSWKDFLKAKSWLTKETGFAPSAPGAPFLCVNDPVQQYLMLSGRTLFLGMELEDLRRMQVDIECFTTEGYEFCNAEREGDKIIAIAFGDQTGWTKVLSGGELSEKELLEQFVAIIQERDPDVIEGHNVFNFDLRYIAKRAKRHGVKLAVGRNSGMPVWRPSRFNVGERTISYQRCNIFGRHIIDTLFLTQAYDITHRSLNGYGLKEVAIHFGLAPRNRTYIEGSKISKEFDRNPEKVMKYVCDDIKETRKLSELLSQSAFIQTQMLPYSYQNACIRGNATKIDALMIREYLRKEHSLPLPDIAREFAGGYTDMFIEGIIENVHHCDVRSLYPSLMLTQKLVPKSDKLGVFEALLSNLREFRINAKERMQKSSTESKKTYFDALQATFKVLINSFYGYLGFSQARFSDFKAAEQVTAEGRSLLQSMIKWMRKHGAEPIEIDTDGIYFVPPGQSDAAKRRSGDAAKGNKSEAGKRVPQWRDLRSAPRSGEIEKFREEFAKFLPEGIEIEFDGEYESMYSYKMKNYALLTYDGEVIIKGAALKSRGLEPFQRSFLKEVIKLKLEGNEEKIPRLKSEYEKAIRNREWSIEKLAKTENLQDAPSTYAAKRAQGKSSRRAVYELALRSGRDYKAGDQISYYVTGEKKSVAVHENSKLVSDWNPKKRDENVVYYLAKLDALYKKFGGEDMQGRLNI
ncbi:DNA polymerase domain-containing protein [Verrucomicrobiota bacterium]